MKPCSGRPINIISIRIYKLSRSTCTAREKGQLYFDLARWRQNRGHYALYQQFIIHTVARHRIESVGNDGMNRHSLRKLRLKINSAFLRHQRCHHTAFLKWPTCIQKNEEMQWPKVPHFQQIQVHRWICACVDTYPTICCGLRTPVTHLTHLYVLFIIYGGRLPVSIVSHVVEYRLWRRVCSSLRRRCKADLTTRMIFLNKEFLAGWKVKETSERHLCT